jgi:hypothetical protein
MDTSRRLDRVTIFNGKISFLIPHEWEQFDEGDDYLYRVPNATSGWFRVSLITLNPKGSETQFDCLEGLFAGRDNVTEDEQTGNRIYAFEKDSEEAGHKIHQYKWLVANAASPGAVREAVFSYTVLQEFQVSDETASMVELLRQVVSGTDFCPET